MATAQKGVDRESVIAYYSRNDVATELVRFSQNREVGGRYENGGYAKRPNALFYPTDVKRMARDGIVSFHTSVELWQNPATLDKRIGWDFLIDLDAPKLEPCRKVAEAIIELLEAHGVNSTKMKFSGRAGFHIFVPWISFNHSLVNNFPNVPRAIGMYLEDYLKKDEILTKEERNNVKIDSVAIAPRHLMRAPYSINEKSGLISIPVKDAWFDLEDAKSENVKVKPFILDAKPGEAMSLVEMSMDFMEKKQHVSKFIPKQIEITKKVPKELFAPSIKKILLGMPDGRKRSEFILRSYLSNLGWNWEEIEHFLLEWNKKNKPPLKETYIKSHISWNKRQKNKLLPPNFSRDGFYKDMGIWTEECSDYKNPLSYTLKRYKWFLKQQKEEEERKKKEEKKKQKKKIPPETTGT